MILRYAVLCDYTNETNDGKLNLFGITEALYAVSFPAIHKHCHLIVSYQVEPDDFGQTRHSEIHFVDIDGNGIMKIEGDLPCPPNRVVMNHRHVIHDLQLPKEGTYQFTIRIDGKEIAALPLEIVRISPQNSLPA